jgi:nucleoid DNA-binding protein
MPLKKIQIAEAIAIQLVFPIARAKALTETLFEIIKRPLESGNDVLISGFS